jgi:hypothetical protein
VCQATPIPQSTVNGSTTEIVAMATDPQGKNLFFADIGTQNASSLDYQGGVIYQMPIAADGTVGTPIPLATSIFNLGVPIVSDGSYVYWVSHGTSAGMMLDGSVARIAVGGNGTVEWLATQQFFAGAQAITGLCVDSTNVYWLDSAGNLIAENLASPSGPVTLGSYLMSGTDTNIVCDGTNVYAGALNTPTYRYTVPQPLMDGGSGTGFSFYDAVSSGWGIAVDTTNVYWLFNGNVVGVPKTATTPASGTTTFVTTSSLSGTPFPSTVLVDPSAFYIAGQDAVTSAPLLAAAPVDGGAASPLYDFSTASYTPFDAGADAGAYAYLGLVGSAPPIAQDAKWIYFVNVDMKTIMRVAK